MLYVSFYPIFISFSEPLGLSYLLGIVGGVLAAFLILFLLCIHVVRTKKCCFKGIFFVGDNFLCLPCTVQNFLNVVQANKLMKFEEWMLMFYFHSCFIEILLWYLFYLFFINLSVCISSFLVLLKYLGRSTYNTKEKDRYVLWFLLFCLLYWCQKIFVYVYIYFRIFLILMLLDAVSIEW